MTIPDDIEILIEEILDDRTHGASQLARQALEVMQEAAEKSEESRVNLLRQELEEIGWRLMSVRPSMAPIYNAVKRLLADIENETFSDTDSLKRFTISQVDLLIQASSAALSQISGHIEELLSDKNSIFTHSYSSTVARALRISYKKHPFDVTLTRSGVGRSGQRIAWELNYDGIPVTFIDDTAIGLYLPNVQVVLVGADRICADGGLVNGIGTYPVALMAQHARVPVYVLCETLKFDPRLKSTDVEIEEKDPVEVAQPGILPEGIEVKNPYFDITPPELISGIITEDGMVKSEDLLHYFVKLTAQLR